MERGVTDSRISHCRIENIGLSAKYGGGIRMAAQHSQSLEAWFTHVPGVVVMALLGPRRSEAPAGSVQLVVA